MKPFISSSPRLDVLILKSYILLQLLHLKCPCADVSISYLDSLSSIDTRFTMFFPKNNSNVLYILVLERVGISSINSLYMSSTVG